MKAFVLLSLFAALAFAVGYEEHTLSFPVSEVPGLISVSTNINTTGLLPGYEYSYNLTVRWAVPAGSLANINADSATVFVKVRPAANASDVYFRDGALGANESTRYFMLHCVIRNGSCASGSTLSQSAPVYYFLTPGANISQEQLVVSAQLVPFANESEIARANQSITRANSTITELATRGIDAANFTILLRIAVERFNNGDYNTALTLGDNITASGQGYLYPQPGSTPYFSPEPGRQGLDQAIAGIDPLIIGAVVIGLLLGLLFFLLRKSRKQKNVR